MKKWMAVIIATVLVMTVFAGCGKKTNEGNNTNQTTDQTTNQETTQDTSNQDGTTQENEAQEESGASTIGTSLLKEFMSLAADSDVASEIAGVLSENKIFDDIAMGTIEVEEGYLNGFDGEVSGFTKGTMFAPMIGTIPFVGYVFEFDDAEGLVESLKDQAMLNWNICTVADEMVVDSKGNLVFFVMCPNSFD